MWDMQGMRRLFRCDICHLCMLLLKSFGFMKGVQVHLFVVYNLSAHFQRPVPREYFSKLISTYTGKALLEQTSQGICCWWPYLGHWYHASHRRYHSAGEMILMRQLCKYKLDTYVKYSTDWRAGMRVPELWSNEMYCFDFEKCDCVRWMRSWYMWV
jgi:hypothetical protein